MLAVFGHRADATLVSEVPATRRIMPALMPTRNESVVFFDLELDAARVDRRVAALREAGVEDASVLTAVVLAAVRVLHERPRLNRFVAGGRLWQRRGIWIAWSAKKEKSDRGAIVVAKRELSPEAKDAALAAVLRSAIHEGRSERKSTTDKELSLLLRLPIFVVCQLVGLVRLLDHLGLLPRGFIDNDPLFASLFVANLGSLGMEPAFHHLYEYGNIPLFCVIGKKRTVVVWDEELQAARPRVVYPLRFTFDERVEDGLYCHGALLRLQALLEEEPPAPGPPPPTAGARP
jgi:hypothetical protein